MDTVDIVGMLVPVTYFVFLLTEKLWPAREFPPRKGWQWIGIALLVLITTIPVVLPLVIPGEWLEAHRWIDGTKLGVFWGTFRNPAKFMGDCGFEAGADRKLGAMLAFADVDASLYGGGNLGAKPGTTST